MFNVVDGPLTSAENHVVKIISSWKKNKPLKMWNPWPPDMEQYENAVHED